MIGTVVFCEAENIEDIPDGMQSNSNTGGAWQMQERNVLAKKKKILYVVEAMGGGVFTYIVDLANILADMYDIYIAYAVRPQTPPNYRDYFDQRITLIEVKNFCREINPIKELAAIREVRHIVDQVKPNLIHLHSSKAGVIGRIAFDGKKIPLFYTPHGYSFLMEDVGFIKRNIYWLIEKTFAKSNCTIISCSFGEYQESIKLTPHATYVNNAINIESLKKSIENVKSEDHPFTVFTLGRICYQKNPELFNRIAQAMPDTKFLWIGDGNLRDKLSSPNIEITGWMDREKALKKSMNADVFLLTSLWEGLSISLLEAMYMKKLCVVSNAIGNRDVIHSGVNGYICNTVEDYVAAIQENKPALREQAYQDLIRHHDIRVQAKKYAAIYEKKLMTFKVKSD